MDLITNLPLSKGFDSILTIVDQGCMKAAKFIPCHKTIDGAGVAHEYLKHLTPWFGMPRRITSDCDPRFTSKFSRTICKALGIQQNLSTAFHSRTDGQTERMNTWIEQYLRPWSTAWQDNWADMLPIAEYTHNSWKHKGTQLTPHELLIGIKPQVDVQEITDDIPAAKQRLEEMQMARKSAQKRLETIQKGSS